MLLDEIFRLMDRWVKFICLLSAIAGLGSILAGKDILAYILIFVTFCSIELWLLESYEQENAQNAILVGINPSSIYTEGQRRAARWGISVILFFTLGLACWLIWTYTFRASIQVYSARYPFTSTGIGVNASDQVEITVAGQNPKWDCGRKDSSGKNDLVGPDGYSNEGYSDTVFEQTYVCALIGSISTSSPENYFTVGSHKSFISADSGMLYLGCNNSAGRFGDNPTSSKLVVEIVVVKRLNIIPIVLAFVVLILGGIALIPKFRQWIFPPNPPANANARFEGLHGKMGES